MSSFKDKMIEAERTDAWQNKITGQGTGCDKGVHATPVEYLIPYKELEALYASDDVAERIVDKLPKAALNKGFDLSPKTDEPFYDYFWEIFRHHKLDEKFLEAWKLARLYGNAVIIFDFEDGQERFMPLNVKAIREIRWSIVMEKPYYEVTEIGTDPMSPYFRKPERIRVIPHSGIGATNNKTLNNFVEFHASRCMFFDGRVLNWNAYQNNNYSHRSVLETCFDHLKRFDSVYAAVAHLVPELRQNIYKMPDFAELVASGKETAVQRRLAAFNMYKSMFRLSVMDAEETLETTDSTFSGVQQIMTEFKNRIVQASGMPHTIALGEGSTGNTSGRTETEEWAATVAEEQQAYLTPKVKWLIDMFAEIKGAPKLPKEGFEITYQSIITESDDSKSERYHKLAQADEIYMRNGVISPNEARSRFTHDGININIEIDDESKLEDDELRMQQLLANKSTNSNSNGDNNGDDNDNADAR